MTPHTRDANFLAKHEVSHLALALDKQITSLLTNENIDARTRVMAARHLIRLGNQLWAWTPHKQGLTT